MQTKSNSLFKQISTKQMENLTTVVKETLATGINFHKSKIFTPADLWNIQRRGKSGIQRRTSF